MYILLGEKVSAIRLTHTYCVTWCDMFSTTGFWALFWAEVLTTLWTMGGGPIDYNPPYPTLFSYVGEHVIVWMALVWIAHLALSCMKKSPFSISFSSVQAAVASYVLVGLFAELATSLFLWHWQATSRIGVSIWSDLESPGHMLRSFITARLTTWAITLVVVFFVAYLLRGRRKLQNQT